MGSSSSKLKSKPSKLFKHASFRRKKDRNKWQHQSQAKQSDVISSTCPENGPQITCQNGHVEVADNNGQQPINVPVVMVTTLNDASSFEVLPSQIQSIDHCSMMTPPQTPTPMRKPIYQSVTPTPTRRRPNTKLDQNGKSQSLAQLIRRNGSIKSKTGSTFSLKRFGSLKSMGSKRWRRSKKNLDESMANVEMELDIYVHPAEIPSDECHFAKLYEQKLHFLIFENFNLRERMSIRSVCRRWQTDVFKQQSYMIYPLFRVQDKNQTKEYQTTQMLQEEERQAMMTSNKYLYWCPTLKTLSIRGKLTRNLMENLMKYCFAKNINKLEFITTNGHKSDIISSNILEQFSKQFGRQLTEIVIDSRIPYGNAFSDLSDVILFLLYTNSQYYTNLVKFQLAISTKLTNGYFQMLQSEFGDQISSLSIQLCFEQSSFVTESLKTMNRISSSMENLKQLQISILPRESNIENNIDLFPLLEMIGKLPNGIEDFSLEIDLSKINSNQLDFITPLGKLLNAKSISLVLFGDLKQMEQFGVQFDFYALQKLNRLEKLKLDSSKISDSDIGELVRYCSNLKELTLGCDVRVSLPGMYQIANHLNQLTSLTIRQSVGPYSVSNRPSSIDMETSREALFIDNESLIVLLTAAPVTMPSLRHITLENCRIDMEDVKLLNTLKQLSLTLDEHDVFSLRLAYNKYPLKLITKFISSYQEYIPDNLKLHWD